MAEKTNITRDLPPETIQQDIARTRQEMSGTVEQIKDRLSPAHMGEHAKETIRETTADRMNRIKNAASRMGGAISSTARDTGSNVLDAVKSNPVPLAMIGAGIAWLMLNRSSAGGRFAERGSALKEKAGEMTGKAQEKLEAVSGQVQEKGSRFTDKARQSAGRFGRSAREQAQATTNRAQDLVRENPLGTLLAVFGVGALVGSLIPESQKEVEMMGSASDSLLTRAKETAQRTFQKAQHAAEQAVHTAEEEFRKSA
ncbi:MAG: hypothetical protein A2010_13175 [Nitrospirae bacterium GWD2_57_9]|nr:MAG: hypothetical protein A2010_13175 [Nitrospirae bacterium GWD2_57_9]